MSEVRNHQMDVARQRNQVAQRRLTAAMVALETERAARRCQLVTDRKLTLQQLKASLSSTPRGRGPPGRGLITPPGLSDRQRHLLVIVAHGRTATSVTLPEFDRRLAEYLAERRRQQNQAAGATGSGRQQLQPHHHEDVVKLSLPSHGDVADLSHHPADDTTAAAVRRLPSLSPAAPEQLTSGGSCLDLYTYSSALPAHVARSPVGRAAWPKLAALLRPQPSMRAFNQSKLARKPVLQVTSQRCLMRRVRTATV